MFLQVDDFILIFYSKLKKKKNKVIIDLEKPKLFDLELSSIYEEGLIKFREKKQKEILGQLKFIVHSKTKINT